MNYSVLPPEINSHLINSGPGSGPLWEAAQAWQSLASQLSSAASSFHSVTSNLTGSWQGSSAQAMTAAAAPYTAWLGAAAAHSEAAATQSKMVARAYEAARAATVKLETIAANRSTLVQLIRANWFGHLAPAIAATEAHYEGMWVQDVTAMAGYHAGASAAGGALAASAVTVAPPPQAKVPRPLPIQRAKTRPVLSAAERAPSKPDPRVLELARDSKDIRRTAAAITLGGGTPPATTAPQVKAPVRAPIRLEKIVEVIEAAGK